MRMGIPTRDRRRIGAMLREMPMHGGDRKSSSHRESLIPSLSDLGIGRRIGAMLREMPMNPGGDPTPSHDVTGCPPTLADLGINRMFSHLWLACHTQDEIAAEVDCDQDTVSDVLRKMADLPKSVKPAADHLTDFEPPDRRAAAGDDTARGRQTVTRCYGYGRPGYQQDVLAPLAGDGRA